MTVDGNNDLLRRDSGNPGFKCVAMHPCQVVGETSADDDCLDGGQEM